MVSVFSLGTWSVRLENPLVPAELAFSLFKLDELCHFSVLKK